MYKMSTSTLTETNELCKFLDDFSKSIAHYDFKKNHTTRLKANTKNHKRRFFLQEKLKFEKARVKKSYNDQLCKLIDEKKYYMDKYDMLLHRISILSDDEIIVIS